jgi:hypothetical protein
LAGGGGWGGGGGGRGVRIETAVLRVVVACRLVVRYWHSGRRRSYGQPDVPER